MTTKEEVYKSIITIQKHTGQGISGIVRIKSSEYDQYINELIEEGLIKCCDTGGSLGHPESNRFYVPTKGYNVWEDNDPHSRFSGQYLTHVRLYLGATDDENIKYDKNDIKRAINRPSIDLVQNPEFMKDYANWLERNHVELEIMKDLDDTYIPKEIIFTDKEIKFIKNRQWYKDNKTVFECLELSKSVNVDEEISILDQLIYLFKSKLAKNNSAEDKVKLEQYTKERRDIGAKTALRKKINAWLSSQINNAPIQNII